MEYTIICPQCGRYRHKGLCNLDKPRPPINFKRVHRELEESASLFCPNCRTKLPLDENEVNCPNCGRTILERLKQRGG